MFNIGAGYDPAVGILDTLGTYGVPATMFVMGWLAEQNPWLVQQIAAWGHPVGSHGYVPPELTTRSDDDVAWDLQTASDTLTWALGYNPGPWFTPYASASDDRVRSIASSLGLITVGWSVKFWRLGPGRYRRFNLRQRGQWRIRWRDHRAASRCSAQCRRNGRRLALDHRGPERSRLQLRHCSADRQLVLGSLRSTRHFDEPSRIKTAATV